MKSLFDEKGSGEIIMRINKLNSSTQAQWGKMNVGQMLAHCDVGLKVAFGEIKTKRGLIGILFGRMAKKQLFKNEPFKKNLPTGKEFLVTDPRKFEEEKKNLISSVDRFYKNGPGGLTKETHPFFGRMTEKEWDHLNWKHLDHHLRQFGV